MKNIIDRVNQLDIRGNLSITKRGLTKLVKEVKKVAPEVEVYCEALVLMNKNIRFRTDKESCYLTKIKNGGPFNIVLKKNNDYYDMVVNG